MVHLIILIGNLHQLTSFTTKPPSPFRLFIKKPNKKFFPRTTSENLLLLLFSFNFDSVTRSKLRDKRNKNVRISKQSGAHLRWTSLDLMNWLTNNETNELTWIMQNNFLFSLSDPIFHCVQLLCNYKVRGEKHYTVSGSLIWKIFAILHHHLGH